MKWATQIIALTFSVVAGVSGTAAGEITQNVYSNEFIGLRFPVPKGWCTATDSEVRELMGQASRGMNLGGGMGGGLGVQMQENVILVVSERPLTSRVQALNRNILILAVSVRQIKHEISSGEDYLRQAAQGIGELDPGITVSDITEQRLGGESFHRLDVALSKFGIEAHVCQLARVHNDYLVVLNITTDSKASLKELTRMAGQLSLSPVPDAVDNSAAGQAFRSQMTPDVLGSSPGPALENAGLTLMAVGALLVLFSIVVRAVGHSGRTSSCGSGKSPIRRCSNCHLLSNWGRGHCVYCGSTVYIRHADHSDMQRAIPA